MRIGYAIRMGAGEPGDVQSRAGWDVISAEARMAEAVGFDIVILEDALFTDENGDHRDYWESFTVAAAIFALTERIQVGHSMVNMPYRAPSLLAKSAATLHEISGGRYQLGLGIGNTSKIDYLATGVPTDYRFSRFAEAFEITQQLLRQGGANVSGKFQSARDAVMTPPDNAPKIVVAANGPKMMRLTARLADGWNSFVEASARLDAARPAVEAFDAACAAESRDPASIIRTVDVLVHAGDITDAVPSADFAQHLLSGSHAQIAEGIRSYAELGFDEVRLYLYPRVPVEARVAAVEAMAPIVERAHAA